MNATTILSQLPIRVQIPMSDEDLFAEEMSGVKPLGREARVRLVKDRLSEDQQKGRQRAAVGEERVLNPLVDDGVMPLDAWHMLEFKRPGIQHGVYRKLRLGQYQIEARLDLHRMLVQQAREEVFSFIREATELGLRTLEHWRLDNVGRQLSSVKRRQQRQLWRQVHRAGCQPGATGGVRRLDLSGRSRSADSTLATTVWTISRHILAASAGGTRRT